MCGIIGLMAKKEELRQSLGELVLPMFDCMAERGPDSAGLAVFGTAVEPPRRRFSLFSERNGYDWSGLAKSLDTDLGGRAEIVTRDNHAEVIAPIEDDSLRQWIKRTGQRRASAGGGAFDRAVQGRGPARRGSQALRILGVAWHALRGPYEDGDRVPGLAGARASVHGGRGLLPRAQRLAVESVQPAPSVGGREPGIRNRQRQRGRLPLPAVADAQGRHDRAGAGRSAGKDRRLLHFPDRNGPASWS